MKTFAIIAMTTFMATMASAASLTWKVSAVKFDGNTLKSNSDVTAYLIYLSSGALSSPYDIMGATTADAVAAKIGTVVDTKKGTGALGSMSDPFNWTYTTKDSANGVYGNGDTFGFLLAYAAEGKTYYNLSTTTYTLSNIADNTSTETMSTASSFTWTTGEDSSSLKAGGGWTAVPEPSTAALALAGLALLLKRRKA
jgi:hypothetical protein